eukprot:455190_1
MSQLCKVVRAYLKKNKQQTTNNNRSFLLVMSSRSPCVVIVFISILIATSTASLQLSFEEGNTKAPQAVDETAVGYDAHTNTILLFGSYINTKQFIKFKDHSFFDGVTNHLSSEVAGLGQGHTQLNSTLWAITDPGDDIISIDLTTYNELANTIVIPTSVEYGACLTSIYHYLIVVGGGRLSYDVPLDNTQIYDINTNQWLSDGPSLRTPRMSLSCIIVNHLLFAIGGYEGDATDTYLDTLETLDVSDMSSIQSKQWQYLDNTLNTARGGTRAVSHGSDIVVIGGKDNTKARVTEINIIDTINGQIYVGGQLAFATSYAASIIVDNILYVFGGLGINGGEKRYQYAAMPTTPPSHYPTLTPSSYPTNIPSLQPTSTPSKYPNVAPSDPSSTPMPTPVMPTKYPTKTPSYAPVTHPITSHPSRSPSLSPTGAPTVRPTTSMPTTVNPTTASPTQPGAMACGEQKVGIYTVGQILVFEAYIPFTGELIFDASGSNFQLKSIESFTSLG